jgi:3-phytase
VSRRRPPLWFVNAERLTTSAGRFAVQYRSRCLVSRCSEPDAGATRTQVDHTGPGGHLVADVEGLALYYAGADRGYLLASSQGNSTIAVYAREGSNAFVGSFRVEANGTIDGVTGSDGLEVTNFGMSSAFPNGLLAVHDNANDGASASNIKYVLWDPIASALGLIMDTGFDPRAARPLQDQVARAN